jgi:hypothetical protein
MLNKVFRTVKVGTDVFVFQSQEPQQVVDR